MSRPPVPAYADLTDYSSLALAAVVQAAELVHGCARGQAVSEGDSRVLLDAIGTQDAESLQDVFPDPARLRPGVTAAIRALSGEPESPEPVRYALELIDLARRLKHNARVLAHLRSRLDALGDGPQDNGELALIYQETISTLGKRIQVSGDPQRLQQEDTAEQIRALLLAGVRFAWLWQQRGGRRWHLLLRRRRLLEHLEALEHIL